MQSRLLEAEVTFVRRTYDHIDQIFDDFSNVAVVFNCTGLGARKLGGIEDTKVYSMKVSSLPGCSAIPSHGR